MGIIFILNLYFLERMDGPGILETETIEVSNGFWSWLNGDVKPLAGDQLEREFQARTCEVFKKKKKRIFFRRGSILANNSVVQVVDAERHVLKTISLENICGVYLSYRETSRKDVCLRTCEVVVAKVSGKLYRLTLGCFQERSEFVEYLAGQNPGLYVDHIDSKEVEHFFGPSQDDIEVEASPKLCKCCSTSMDDEKRESSVMPGRKKSSVAVAPLPVPGRAFRRLSAEAC